MLSRNPVELLPVKWESTVLSVYFCTWKYKGRPEDSWTCPYAARWCWGGRSPWASHMPGSRHCASYRTWWYFRWVASGAPPASSSLSLPHLIARTLLQSPLPVVWKTEENKDFLELEIAHTLLNPKYDNTSSFRLRWFLCQIVFDS